MEQSSIKERDDVRTGKPRKFTVVLHNDDFTTMEFVVKVLTDVFYKPRTEAYTIMRAVHEQGEGRVGAYPYDLAKSRCDRAVAMAREEGFPLRLSVEPIS